MADLGIPSREKVGFSKVAHGGGKKEGVSAIKKEKSASGVLPSTSPEQETERRESGGRF